nr:Chain C, Isocitrate dehydrogenase [NADP], mitochondrial [Homo sapiens]6UJ7_F Chain F, Isocitrate dehydrogenase [NADP], mitochondrial [Homo sapiens]6UJ9_C Chain C, Isocitrate dehydrogenase [NADP], mitochondrial [Homo sapiens]
SPNGTIQNIL